MTAAPRSRAVGEGRVPLFLLLAFSALEAWQRLPVLTGAAALYGRDLLLLYFPGVHSLLRAVAGGALPLRDPASAFGQAVLSDPSNQLLYPPAWLHLLLPPPVAYGWFVSIHSVFGALGIALLCRRLSGGSTLGALTAGATWLLCGPLQSLATLWHHLSGAAWIPWVLLGVERVLESPDRRRTVDLGVILGAQMLAGSADMCAMTLLLAALRGLLAGGWRHWKSWGVSGGIGLCLSAGAWLPALTALGATGRAALPESTRTFWSLHPLSILEFFLPLPLYILPLNAGWKAALYESREPFLGSMFLGGMTLPLLLAGVFASRVSPRIRLAYGGGALAGLLAALGKHSLAYGLFVALIPPLAILRYPTKAMIPVAVLVCVLAGIGVESLRHSGRSRWAAAAGCLLLGAVALGFLGPLRPPFEAALFDTGDAFGMDQFHRNFSLDLAFTLGLLALVLALVRWPSVAVLIGLLLVGSAGQSRHILEQLNPTVPLAVLGYKPEHLEQLRPSAQGRVMVYDYSLLKGAAGKHLGTPTLSWSGLEDFGPDAGTVVATHAYFMPLTGAAWGLEYAWDTDLRLLFDQRLVELTNSLRLSEGSPDFLKLLQISGVEKVAALHEDEMQDLTLLGLYRIFHREPLRIFAVPRPLPYAHLTSGRRNIRGSDTEALLDADFDPRTTVLVDAGSERAPLTDFAGSARLLERRADRMALSTSSDHPGFLTILEGALPGWRVWIDGRPGKVERANAIFVGAEVPAGNHQVEFRFLPLGALAGAGVSIGTGLLLLVGGLKRLARPSGSPPSPSEG